MTQKLGVFFVDGEEGIIDTSTGKSIARSSINVSDATSQYKYGSRSVYFPKGEWLYTPDSEDFDWHLMDNFTIDFWLKPSLGDNGGGWMQHCSSSSWEGTNLMLRGNNGNASFEIGGPDVSMTHSPVGGINDGNWHHVAGVKHGDNYYLFYDGVLVETRTSSAAINNNTAHVYFGASTVLGASGYCVNGYMDNMRIVKDEALWTDDFELTDESMFYIDVDGYVRPESVTGLYHSKKQNLRGMASQGYIRPTIKQFFTSDDWEAIIK